MKTYKNREGKYVAEEPESFYVGLDAHGEEVFTGDYIYDKTYKRVTKVEKRHYSYWYLEHSVLIKHGLEYKIAQ